MKDKETIIKVLNILQKRAESSQRDISASLGISVGKVNYVINSLIAEGYVKTESFINSRKKWAYRYILTPEGIKEKMRITRKYIRKKIIEYEELLRE